MNQYPLKPKERVPPNLSNQKTSIAAMKVKKLLFIHGSSAVQSWIFHALVGLIVLYMNLHFSGNDGYVAFQVEGNPVPTVEWFKVGLL